MKLTVAERSGSGWGNTIGCKWSPDGTKLFAGECIWWVDRDTTLRRLQRCDMLPKNIDSGNWIADSRRFAYTVSVGKHVHMWDTSLGRDLCEPEHDNHYTMGKSHVSAIGKFILMTTCGPFTDSKTMLKMYIISEAVAPAEIVSMQTAMHWKICAELTGKSDGFLCIAMWKKDCHFLIMRVEKISNSSDPKGSYILQKVYGADNTRMNVGSIVGSCWTPDKHHAGEYLFAVMMQRPANEIRIWHSVDGRVDIVLAPVDAVHCTIYGWSPDGNYLLLGDTSKDIIMAFWPCAEHRREPVKNMIQPITVPVFSPCGTYVACLGRWGGGTDVQMAVARVDPSGAWQIGSRKNLNVIHGSVESYAWSVDGRLAIGTRRAPTGSEKSYTIETFITFVGTWSEASHWQHSEATRNRIARLFLGMRSRAGTQLILGIAAAVAKAEGL